MKRVTNLSPFPAGTKLTSRNPPAPEMCIVVRGKFRLAPGEPVVLAGDDVLKQGPLTGDVFAEDDDEFKGPVAYASDLADFKPKTDILVVGDCCPPGGQPAVSCIATAMVGAWQKSLLAVGRRRWLDRSRATDPEPFLRMPITWENAYGGPGFAANPVGLGWGEPTRDAALPTIGPAGDRVRMPEMTGVAASFRPLSPFWPQRRAKVGRNYGADYQRTRAPYFSDDFDWTHFNAAPEDQQLDGYLNGNEELRFINLHPDSGDFAASLPGLRIRAFVHKIAGPFAEVTMHLDTLLADLNEGLLYLIWRGLTPVASDDFSDVGSVLVAQEKLDSTPEDTEGYFAKLLEAEQPIQFGIHLLPAHAREALRAHFPESGPVSAGATAMPAAPATAPAGAPSDAVTAFVKAKIAASPLAGMTTMTERLLPHMVAKSDANGGQLRAWLADTLAKTQAAAATAVSSSTPTLSPQAISALKKIPGFLDRMAAAAPSIDLSALRILLSSKAVADLIPADPPPEEADALAQRGGDLSGQDFSGRDLSRRDFSGMNLTGCRFVGAILAGTRFDGATLVGADFTDATLERTNLGGAIMLGVVAKNAAFKQAQLAGADISGADFSGATLETTSAAGVKAVGAVFAGAKLRGSSFSKGNLTDANLSGAEFAQCDFSEAILERVNAARSTWRQTPMNNATLDGATMDGAILHRIAFRGTSAIGASFARCDLANTGFMTTDLSNAVFFECAGVRTNWQGAKLDGADFRRAVLPGALFLDIEAEGANFDEADLTKARFRKATLRGVTFVHAKLLRANFDRTTIEATRFDEANLFRARFYKVEGKTNTYEGAILSRLIVVQP